jgi:hypothetical protein
MSEQGRGAAWYVWINGTAWARHAMCESALKVSSSLSVGHPYSLFPLWFPIKIFCMFLISPFLAQHTSWNRLSPRAAKDWANNSVCRNRSILTREIYTTDKSVTTSALYCEVCSLRRRGGKPGVENVESTLHPSKICEVFYSLLITPQSRVLSENLIIS